MFFLLMLLWFVFSLSIRAETAVAGAVISVAVYWFARRHMHYNHLADRKMLSRLLLGIRYALTVILETGKANLAVFRIVFSRAIEIEPRLVYFRTDLKTNAARVALANSITLTPGTITVALDGDLFCVHCLSEKLADGIEDSAFVRQLRKFEA